MKTKSLWLASGALVAALGIWFGCSAWRAHRHLVTLDVRNVPLAEVLRKIERQTDERIRAEKNLDTHITLHLTDKPLAYVLDRIAEQAGARLITMYAVYDSTRALTSLEPALRGEARLDAVGWTKLAPDARALELTEAGGPQEARVIDGPGADPQSQLTKLPPGAVVTANEDVVLRGPKDSGAGGSGAVSREHGPMVVRMMRRGAGEDASSVEEEVWSPEELVMESALVPRLGGGHAEEASAAAAAETARKVNGHWAAFFALRKSRFGANFGGLHSFMPPPGGGRMIVTGPGMSLPGTNLDQVAGHIAQAQASIEDAMRRHRNDELGRLTPEQRVQRARERQGIAQP